MSNESKTIICLLLLNNGKTQNITARYHDEGEALNVATLLNKLASPIKNGRYSVVAIEASDTVLLTKYGYFDYDFNDSWDDEITIEFDEGEGDPNK